MCPLYNVIRICVKENIGGKKAKIMVGKPGNVSRKTSVEREQNFNAENPVFQTFQSPETFF